MRTLYLLRHAKSSWAEPALPDRNRPLAPRGRRDANRIAKHLVRLEIQPELVLCSSAVRTCETLERLRVARGGGSTVRLEDELYGASAEQLLYRLFHQRGVRVFRSRHLDAQCSCSRDGVERMLRSFSQDDRDHMVENGVITVTCEFCNSTYVFEPAEVADAN